MTGIAMVLRVTDGGEIDSHDDRIIKFNGDQVFHKNRKLFS